MSNFGKKSADEDAEEAQKQATYMKVQRTLNKITPLTFDHCLQEYLDLNINDEEQLRRVIDLILVKIIEEPKDCSMFADFCFLVSMDELIKSGHNKSKFRSILLNKVQADFEKNSLEEIRSKKQQEMDCAETDAVWKELQGKLDGLFLLVKEIRRQLMTVSFIGELYLRKILTVKIMFHCIQQLLGKIQEDESLTCLCKLLKTIGSQLDEEPGAEVQRMRHLCYDRLEVQMPHCQRPLLQSMIKNLLDLRANKWQMPGGCQQEQRPLQRPEMRSRMQALRPRGILTEELQRIQENQCFRPQFAKGKQSVTVAANTRDQIANRFDLMKDSKEAVADMKHFIENNCPDDVDA